MRTSDTGFAGSDSCDAGCCSKNFWPGSRLTGYTHDLLPDSGPNTLEKFPRFLQSILTRKAH